ncbi:MAG: hypothetical protein CSB16_01380 [Clostridiales bacterium]|nr:MAG: hypothetical protein CSB16_01380 [Clostridiales bacterium]
MENEKKQLVDSDVIQSSFKLSAMAELISKLIGPISVMILARILLPKDFGVVAGIMMLVSFSNVITDSGFSKYIIFNDFDSDSEEREVALVSFWTNFIIALIIYFLLFFFAGKVSILIMGVYNPLLIRVSGIIIVISSFCSVQNALLKKHFKFKAYFWIRIAYTVVPLLITVPLAILLRSYWALIIGNIINIFVNFLLLKHFVKFVIEFKYPYKLLKKMYKFCLWSLSEGVIYWLLIWVDTFIVAKYFSIEQLGLFKGIYNMVISILSIVGATIMAVVFTTLSRFKNDKTQFKKTYLSMLKVIAYIVLPMGVGMFAYQKPIVKLLFGSRWSEGHIVLGMMALMYSLNILFVLFNTEVLKSLGRPKVVFYSNILQLSIIIVGSILGTRNGFNSFLHYRTALIIPQIVMIIIFILINSNYLKDVFIKGLFGPAVSVIFMYMVYLTQSILKIQNIFLSLIMMLITGIMYLLFVRIVFKEDFYTVLSFFRKKV